MRVAKQNLAEHFLHAISKRVKKLFYGNVPGVAGSFTYFGTKIHFPRKSLIFQRACEEIVYEEPVVRFLSGVAKANTALVDIGANIGLISVPLLRLRPDCNVISFEPSPNAAPFLQRTREESDFSRRWQVSSKALSDRAGSAEFFICREDLGAHDGFCDTKRVEVSRRVAVPVSTLDVEWNTMGRPSISIIKIDVEGAELNVLKGATKCIQSEKPIILIEWNATNLKAYDYLSGCILPIVRDMEYEILSFPYFGFISNAAALDLQMLQTENFVLVPIDYPVEKFSFLHAQSDKSNYCP